MAEDLEEDLSGKGVQALLSARLEEFSPLLAFLLARSLLRV